MQDKSQVSRSVWLAYALVGVFTLVTGLSFNLVSLTRPSATPKTWGSFTTPVTV